MTLNINFYEEKHGPWPVRRKLISEVIQEHDVDIVALQAVRKDPNIEAGIDQGLQLARQLPDYQHAIFVPASTSSNGTQDGSAWISRLPLIETSYTRLPLSAADGTAEDCAQRLVMQAHVRQPDLQLFNCHFSWVPLQAASNIDAALSFIRNFSGPCLLMGDFNMTPERPALRSLRTHGMVDLWLRLHPTDPGFTFESHAPNQRIDYVWATDDLLSAIKGLDIVPVQTNRDQPRLSDHCGLVVTIL